MALQSSNVFGNGSGVPAELRLPLRYRIGFAFSGVSLILFGLYLRNLSDGAYYPEVATKFNLVTCGFGAFVMLLGYNRRRFWTIISTVWATVTLGTLALVAAMHDDRLASITVSLPYCLVALIVVIAIGVVFVGPNDSTPVR